MILGAQIFILPHRGHGPRCRSAAPSPRLPRLIFSFRSFMAAQRLPAPLSFFSPAPGPARLRRGRERLLGALLATLFCLLALPFGAEAAMDYAKQVLIGADFHGADLRGVTFNLTNLRDADLHGADLRNASLFGAKLQDADLSDADLRESTLDSAVLDGTDLRNARLDDAFAFNTKFINVRIEGADFTNVPLRGDALKTLCAAASGTNPSSGRNTRDTLGCS
jgi:uncharacterized protein YjbI with pentapeptide repeats